MDDFFFFSCFSFFFSLVLSFAAFCFSFLPLSLLPLSPIAMFSVLGLSGFRAGRRPPSSSSQPRRSDDLNDGILSVDRKYKRGFGSTPRVESPRGVSPRGAHRTVREPLDSHGSYHPVKPRPADTTRLLPCGWPHRVARWFVPFAPPALPGFNTCRSSLFKTPPTRPSAVLVNTDGEARPRGGSRQPPLFPAAQRVALPACLFRAPDASDHCGSTRRTSGPRAEAGAH